MHWGKELLFKPLPYQRRITRHLLSVGVHVIIGSHPHVLQPHCIHGNKLVAYSLGNFLFPPTRLLGGNDPVSKQIFKTHLILLQIKNGILSNT